MNLFKCFKKTSVKRVPGSARPRSSRTDLQKPISQKCIRLHAHDNTFLRKFQISKVLTSSISYNNKSKNLKTIKVFYTHNVIFNIFGAYNL